MLFRGYRPCGNHCSDVVSSVLTRRSRPAVRRFYADSGGELLSALGSAAGKNLAAVRGGHSLAEAVLHFALTLFGLVRSFHADTPPFFGLL